MCSIFAKLDAKNLYRVHTVYKNWYRICVDPVFIDEHAAGSKSSGCTHVIACYLRPLDPSSLGIYRLNIDYNNQMLSKTFLDLPKYLKQNNIYFFWFRGRCLLLQAYFSWKPERSVLSMQPNNASMSSNYNPSAPRFNILWYSGMWLQL
ncbi:uncharacterized protein G2W53_035021 [Senna tora]|uniref:Uncharacterized protein n=1 Tax=Senna tora TaxID=362788 RepID=A0A834W4J0_9FABA|nr:uncharacterized protein G2W53_035021 [Senna tora]